MRTLATGDRSPRLGQGLAHVELVVHRRDHTRRDSARRRQRDAGEATPT
jgi:hypothetical protein